jgi:UDP-glucose 4-epimerase
MSTKKKYLVTGGAGCIGSHLVARLVERGHVVVYDNLHLGQRRFVEPFVSDGRAEFVQADLLDLEVLVRHMAGATAVFHMAANSDISQGRKETALDLRLGTQVTHSVLEAMRRTGVRDIVFASSSAIYGDEPRMPTPEDYGPLFPISLYGASKLACEALVSAFVHNYDLRAWIYRFGNITGPHPTHGVVLDFVGKLRRNPRELEILGDGRQAKPYLHVDECVDGMLFGFDRVDAPLSCFNLACDGATTVRQIADEVVASMGLVGVAYRFSGGSRGWRGDVPQVRLDPARFAAHGWSARRTSDQAVRDAVRAIVAELAASP